MAYNVVLLLLEASDCLLKPFKIFFDKIYVRTKKRLLGAKFKVLAKIYDKVRKYISNKINIYMSKKINFQFFDI